MLDNRIYTFLELCNVMNYHKTAENLQMTQPAVTQHIKFLEQRYQCKLFHYANKQLSKTAQCVALERHARAMVSLSLSAGEALFQQETIPVGIGATKTIGEYTIDDALLSLLSNPKYEVSITVDNTEVLLEKLNQFHLDLLLLEGYFNKSDYQYRKISSEKIVGICAQNHPFAHQIVSLEQLLQEGIILREKGSGSRAIFEDMLWNNGYTLENFSRKTFLNSNKLIEMAVSHSQGVSFVYDAIPRQNPQLATFTVEGSHLEHGFYFVFLNEDKVRPLLDIFAPNL